MYSIVFHYLCQLDWSVIFFSVSSHHHPCSSICLILTVMCSYCFSSLPFFDFNHCVSRLYVFRRWHLFQFFFSYFSDFNFHCFLCLLNSITFLSISVIIFTVYSYLTRHRTFPSFSLFSSFSISCCHPLSLLRHLSLVLLALLLLLFSLSLITICSQYFFLLHSLSVLFHLIS